MRKNVTRILFALAVFVLLYAGTAVVSTLTQLADVADRVHAGSGQAVFWVLLSIFSALAITPVVMYLKLPKPINPPENMEEPGFSQYRAWLLLELKGNPHLLGVQLDSIEDIPNALEILSRKANTLIKNSASAIFVSTALMQNGRLDGLLMLATQLRLVWQVAALYHRRPSPRQILYMYSNVGAAMLIAGSLDEVDFAELASPIVASSAPSLASAVPGLQGIASLLTNCLANGAANAFLTLRVGMMAKAYSAPMVHPEKSAVRRGATRQALAFIGDITKENGARIAKGIWQTVSSPITDATNAAAQGVRTASSKAANFAVATATNVGDAFNATAGQVKGGALAIAETTSDVGKRIGRAVDATADGAKSMTTRAAQAATGAIRRSPKLAIEHQSAEVLPPTT